MSTTVDHRGGDFLVLEAHHDHVVTPEDLGEEERMLMEAFVDFATREVGPHLPALVAGDGEIGRRLFEKAAELGIFMAEVPEEYGGLDLNVLAVTGMCSVRAKLGSLGSYIFGHQGIGMIPLINFANADQRARYLEPCMSGEVLSAFALTEPGTGSDAMNITTRAVLAPEGTHYIVNGAKQWITNAAWADIFILFAKVDGEHFTAFILDGDTPGLTVGENERLLGQHGSSVAALSLEDVHIPVENLLGEVGLGHKVAFCTLNMGRLKLAANSSSGAKEAVEVAARYAAERIQFGRPIGEFGLIQRKLADMSARAYAAESVAWRTAGLVYHGLQADAQDSAGSSDTSGVDSKLAVLSEFSAECALAKVHTSESYNALADEALQVFGGYGFSEEYAPAAMYRDSRITRIYEGTNEICRLYAQRAIMRRSWKGLIDLAGPAARLGATGPQATDDDSFEGLGAAIPRLKEVYLYLNREVEASIDRENMFDADHQQFMACLADIAIEIYAAESTFLRVEKLRASGSASENPEALARIYFERARDRILQESRVLLAELFSGQVLADHLTAIQGRFPLPVALRERRAIVARALMATGKQIT